MENTWPGERRHAMHQHEHEKWNAQNYPGTLQLCCQCDQPTDRCEDDEIYTEDGIGPLCVDCWHGTDEWRSQNGLTEGLKPRPQRPDYDMSKTSAMNITKLLTQEYGRLVQITEPYELAEEITELATPLVGKSLRKENYNTFIRNLNQAADKGLIQLQQYLTNFILKGSGLKVMEHVDPMIISQFITEEIHQVQYLTANQKYLKKLVESNTILKVAPIYQ